MIYIASPFFNDTEINILSSVEQLMRDRGLTYYSPREHEERSEKDIVAGWYSETFRKDREAIKSCDIVIALYHGNYSDSGTAWECGYAYGLGKPVIVVHVGNDSNLMIHESAKANITLAELKEYNFEELPAIKYKGKAF